MKEKKTVLLTSAGVATAANVISSLKMSTLFDFNIVSVDMDDNAAGLYLSDRGYIVPPADDPAYLDKIIKIINENNVDFVFPLYSKEIALFAENTAKILETGARVLLPDTGSIKLCDNKKNFIKYLDSAGFLHPVTYDMPEEILNFPVFIKPVSGSSSANAFKITDRHDLEYHLKKQRDVVIQEFVDAKEYTVDCLADNASNLVACIPRERIKVKDGKTIVGKTVKNAQMTSMIKRLISAMHFVGPCNIQLFDRAGDVLFIEMNPRLAAGGLPLSTAAGVNIPELMIRLAFGESVAYQDYTENLKMIRYFSEVFTHDEEFETV